MLREDAEVKRVFAVGADGPWAHAIDMWDAAVTRWPSGGQNMPVDVLPEALQEVASSADIAVVDAAIDDYVLADVLRFLQTNVVILMCGGWRGCERIRSAMGSVARGLVGGLLTWERFGDNQVILHSACGAERVWAGAIAGLFGHSGDGGGFAASARCLTLPFVWGSERWCYFGLCSQVAAHGFSDDTWLVGADLARCDVKALPDSAFSGCTRLLGVHLPAALNRLEGSCLWGTWRMRELECGPALVDVAAVSCFASGLAEFSAGAQLERLGTESFALSAVRSVDLLGSASLTVGEGAFMGCAALQRVRLGRDGEVMGGAFSGTAPSTIRLSGGMDYSADAFAAAAPALVEFCGLYGEYKVFPTGHELRSPPVTTLFTGSGDRTEWGGGFVRDPTLLTWNGGDKRSLRARAGRASLRIASGTPSFSGCHGIVIADLSSLSLTKLPGGAFSSCVALEVASMPGGLRTISARCFSGCLRLRVIDGVASSVTLATLALHCTPALRHLGWVGRVRGMADHCLWLSAVERLSLFPGAGRTMDVSGAGRCRLLKVRRDFTGGIDIGCCVGLRDLMIGRVAWIGERVLGAHPSVLRFLGAWRVPSDDEAAAFELSRVFAEIASVSRRHAVPDLPM